MKRKVPRPGPRRDPRVPRIVRRQRPLIPIEVIHQHIVKPQVRRQSETIVRRYPDPVRVRRFLPLLVHARPGMLHESRHQPQAPVVMHRKRRYAPAVVVRHQREPSRLVERHEARPRAVRGNLVQRLQHPAFAIDRKRTERSAFQSIELADLVHRIQIFAAGMHGHKRRVCRLRRQPDQRKLPRRRIEAERVDPLAALLGGVGTDVGEILPLARPGLLPRPRPQHHRRRQNAQTQQNSAGHVHKAWHSNTASHPPAVEHLWRTVEVAQPGGLSRPGSTVSECTPVKNIVPTGF